MNEHLINIIASLLIIFSTIAPVIWRLGRLTEKVENQKERFGIFERTVEEKINKLVEKIDKMYELIRNKI